MLETPPVFDLASDRSPKSIAFPSDAIFTKSITVEVEPPPKNARILFDVPPASISALASDKSPNLVALPVVAMVKNSILLPVDALPAINPRVLLAAPDGPLVATDISPKSVAAPVVAIVTNSILLCVSGDAGVFLPPAKIARVGDANPA